MAAPEKPELRRPPCIAGRIVIGAAGFNVGRGGNEIPDSTPAIAFIGCNGADVRSGVTNVNLPEAEVKRAMLLGRPASGRGG
jgi:DeoR/GlpR family transcriptional regulator of sugar metabolism